MSDSALQFPMRINKYIAKQGLASRREADQLISDGLVHINDIPATLGQDVHERDRVQIIGKQPTKHYLAYYKGRGVITHSPADGEVDIMSKLRQTYPNAREVWENVSPVGRLDKDSEGLILLSNDGRIPAPLLDPEAGHEKTYHVQVDKPVNPWFLRHMRAGVNIEGYVTKPADAKQTSQHRFALTLTEGKKHQIRRMCAALGYQVAALTRTRIMHIELAALKPNQYRKLQKAEIKTLLADLQIEKP